MNKALKEITSRMGLINTLLNADEILKETKFLTKEDHELLTELIKEIRADLDSKPLYIEKEVSHENRQTGIPFKLA